MLSADRRRTACAAPRAWRAAPGSVSSLNESFMSPTPRSRGPGTCVLIGSLLPARFMASSAISRSTPPSSNITVPGLHRRHPVLRGALALAHAGLGRLLGVRLVGEDADPHLAAALHVAGDGDTARLDLAVGDPVLLQGHQAVVAEGDLGAAGGHGPSSARAAACGTSFSWGSACSLLLTSVASAVRGRRGRRARRGRRGPRGRGAPAGPRRPSSPGRRPRR